MDKSVSKRPVAVWSPSRVRSAQAQAVQVHTALILLEKRKTQDDADTARNVSGPS